MHAVEQGTPFDTVVESQKAFGFPMDPFVLLELVGLKVGAHVLDTHHAAFPDRFFESASLHELAEYGHILEKDSKGKVTGYDKKALAIVASHTAKDATPYTAEELRIRIEDGLADEIHRMLEDGVVEAAEDVDLGMILGAGWPFQMGGATPYLDRVGASERAFGDTFHHPVIKGVS
jgi:3-hydroxyacyl-CoA dehydrogenase